MYRSRLEEQCRCGNAVWVSVHWRGADGRRDWDAVQDCGRVRGRPPEGAAAAVIEQLKTVLAMFLPTV